MKEKKNEMYEKYNGVLIVQGNELKKNFECEMRWNDKHDCAMLCERC